MNRWKVAAGIAAAAVVAGTTFGVMTSVGASGSVTTDTCSRVVSDAGETISCPMLPTATVTVTQTVTATPSDSPPDTGVPTTTPPPPPSTSTPPPPSSGFPDGTNTGVPAGTALSVYSGSKSCSSGTVTIDAKTVTGSLTVRGTCHLVVTRSVINGTVDSEGSNVVASISDSEVNGGQQSTFATVSEDNLTLARDNIHGGKDAVEGNLNVTITDSWLHGQYLAPGSQAHNNGFLSNGGGPFNLQHDTLTCDVAPGTGSGGCSGPYDLYGDFAQVHDATINNSYLATNPDDDAFAAWLGCNSGKAFPVPRNIVFTNNVVAMGHYKGYTTDYCAGNGDVFTGNTSKSTGAALTPNQ